MNKRERGSAALLVFATVMFILIILSTIMTAVYLKNRSQLSEFEELRKTYSGGDMSEVFREKMGFNEQDAQNSIIWNYDYTGAVQEFIAPYNGTYKIEAWGASGGDAKTEKYGAVNALGGKGAYVSGIIKLSKNDRLYVQVGQSGVSNIWNIDDGIISGGYNGGGPTKGQYDSNIRAWGAGGGATDIRLVKGSWRDFNSLKSRIMVAAGGGGAFSETAGCDGGSAGGLEGYNGSLGATYGNNWGSFGYGGSQTNAGYTISYANTSINGTNSDIYYYSKFGFAITNARIYSAGGGGGYYGGANSSHVQSAGGGSSFISGHNGCDAITQASTENNIVHTGSSTHYSGLTFTQTVMVDGLGYSWTTEKGSHSGQVQPDGTTTEKGHVGNGFARITFLQ